MNTQIVTDLPGLFSDFMIDLSDITTGTKFGIDKPGMIKLFENLLNENPDAISNLDKNVYPTTCNQYLKGI